MTQKPMLRAEVGMGVRCANKASAEYNLTGYVTRVPARIVASCERLRASEKSAPPVAGDAVRRVPARRSASGERADVGPPKSGKEAV